MKIHDVKQGTAEWLACRAGIPTASELDSLVSPTGKIRTGETPHTYLCRKLAERWQGFPLPSFSGGVMEQGAILESEALPYFQLTRGVAVERIGFITTDDGSFGCSPDGLLPDGSGLEIKCPQPPNHLRWLLAGVLPPDHALQCHGGMYATGAKRWTFLSYCRGFPEFVVEVEHDPIIHDTIADALADFGDSMDSAWKRLIIANGGALYQAQEDTHPF